jgi:glycosyltransferase involved in cell wall biosynthesis
VPPGDGRAMAAAVTKYAGDAVLRSAEGRAGRSFVETRFRREDQGEALADLLLRVTGRG